MKKIWVAMLCALVLSGCGKAERSAAVQEQYAALDTAEMTAQITCHLPKETRQYQVNCIFEAEKGAEIVITAPEQLTGIKATVSGKDLTLSYDDLALSAGQAGAISPVNCLPWLLWAAAEGYVLEEGQETLEEKICLRVAFDTTGPDGEKVICTTWFDRETLFPVYCEFSQDGRVEISVKLISFTARTGAIREP